jgi:hypothetical protein
MIGRKECVASAGASSILVKTIFAASVMFPSFQGVLRLGFDPGKGDEHDDDIRAY